MSRCLNRAEHPAPRRRQTAANHREWVTTGTCEELPWKDVAEKRPAATGTSTCQPASFAKIAGVETDDSPFVFGSDVGVEVDVCRAVDHPL